MNDLKFAGRQLLKNPGFTLVVVLVLAVGIGANTAIFSIIQGVLLKPLPYPHPDRLVTLWERDSAHGIDQERVSGPDYLDWRAQNSVFSDLAVCPGWDTGEFNLVLRDRVVKVHGTYASASLFTTLGGSPLLGRTLGPEADQKEGPSVVVLGYGLWQRYFGGNPGVLGQRMTLDSYGRRDYQIVGVMPPGYGVPSGCELWLPLGWMGVSLDERRSAHWHTVIARLKPGVLLAQAQAQMNAIQDRLKRAYPGETIGSQTAVVPLVEQAVGPRFRTALLALWGVVAGVLLIACANVANLMLARAASRRKETAVRQALGASRQHLIRQLLTEGLLLTFLGGALGVLLADWGVKLLVAAAPPGIPRLADVALDGTTLLYTLVSAALTGLLFGLAPAWRFSRPDLNVSLKEDSRGFSAGAGARSAGQALVVAQVALALVLLVGAGLMLRSFARLLTTDRGMRPEQLLTAELDFSVSGFTTWVGPTATRPQVHLAELLERVRHLPGVESAGAAYRLVRSDNDPPNQPFAIFGRPRDPRAEPPTLEANALTPGCLDALGTRLLRGRDFTEADTLQAPGVALVNETFVRRFFPDQDPIGKHLTFSKSPEPLGATDQYGVSVWCQIIGVVDDVESFGLPPESVPQVYRSYWQFPMQNPTLVVHATGNAAGLASAIQREVHAVIPNLPVPQVRPMTDRLHESLAQPQFATALLALFGALGLFLAACGLYGVLAYSVARRGGEIGIRMALGARPANILMLVIGEGLKLTLMGLAIGAAAALALTRTIQSLLYGVEPTDPATFAGVALLLLVVAFLACWVPGRRAARTNPMVALRHD